ncbi:Mitochondrial J-type chaperone [Ceraceosorus bombacis]|uniref:Mitochondrial J-type chaperone n=1 Tax=Ceraceosorus bombacis TaxID=401625 RepID=A0A0P1BD00_9BASI|nr:Mitochondrial J-type chaperone [Ceraceosorus bombacis]
MTHPDRARQRGEKQEQLALAQSSVLNKAYQTLRNPLARATWLLEHGSHAAPSEEEGVEDPALLMQVMEFREALEEASNEEQAEQVGSDNQLRLQSTLRALDDAFSKAQPEYEKIKSLIIQLRYWMNIDKAAREWSPGQRVELKH